MLRLPSMGHKAYGRPRAAAASTASVRKGQVTVTLTTSVVVSPFGVLMVTENEPVPAVPPEITLKLYAVMPLTSRPAGSAVHGTANEAGWAICRPPPVVAAEIVVPPGIGLPLMSRTHKLKVVELDRKS